MDHSLWSPSVHGICQVRILKLVAVPSCRGPSQPRDQIRISYIPTSCGFRVTSLVFCKRIATKSGFLPLWVLSHLLNETGSWPVWWVWPVGSMVKGSEPGGRVWEFREVIPLDPSLQLGNVTLCCGHDAYGTALPTYWLPGHPSYLLPNFILWSPGQWLSDTASSRWHMAISVNNPC